MPIRLLRARVEVKRHKGGDIRGRRFGTPTKFPCANRPLGQHLFGVVRLGSHFDAESQTGLIKRGDIRVCNGLSMYGIASIIGGRPQRNEIREMSLGIHHGLSETSLIRSYNTRRSRGALSPALSGPTPKAIIDKFAIVPISACVFALIVDPLLIFFTDFQTLHRAVEAAEARPGPRFFWPTVAVISVLLAVQNRSRLTFPPPIICLFAYLAFAGASVLWAFSPEHSSVRYLQQMMIVISIVLPVLLAARTVDMMRALFLCFGFSLILNLLCVFGGSATVVSYGSQLVNIGYQGYFNGKNYLGECAAVALLLSIHEMLHRGWRRAFGAVVALIAILLVFLSDSKTAFGLALICPFLAALTLLARKVTRISVAIILLTIPFCFILFSEITHSSLFSRISYILYHDSTLTGRTIIWDFAESEIEMRPLSGWGYQSFWLVPNSPSLEGPGWVKMMPNAHNGYYDTMLETGYVGLALLLIFILVTLHAVGRVADRDPRRARAVLSLALFIILYNFFESLWMRGFEFLWVVFLILVADIGRYWGPFSPNRAAYKSRSQSPGSPGPLPRARVARLRLGLS
jgi:exopolysaccharide production protein ExoQ